uniref:C2 domain-containing protein n=1 Tax=Oxyrrhis marina TaxID=2969 RepID=A0A7S3UM90_OXYMA|mmetsp:Transcript_337/g.541  ORF Transcript_337/g.541 Transcript_337/m.541 type:complete len:140 (-) Transcript_337:76-495(-)
MATISGRVLRANGLPNKDLFSKDDPYVVVKMFDADGNEAGESRTSVKKGNNVEWDGEEAVFNFGNAHLEGRIEFKVWDKDLGPDDLIGESVVPLSAVPFQETEMTLSLGFSRKLSAAGKKTPNGTITVRLLISNHHNWL